MLKAKKYGFFDYIRIPSTVAPVYFMGIIILRAISALIPSARIFILSDFIDTANRIFNHEAEIDAIYPALLLYAATVAYSHVYGTFLGFINTRMNMKLTLTFKEQVLAKRASLEYRYIEDDKTWDLINRAAGDPQGKILSGFGSVLDLVFMLVQAGSIIAVLASYVWWAAIPSIITAIPMYIISVKRGKKDYEENKEAQKHSRRSWIYGGLLVYRDNVEERSMFSYSARVDEEWYGLFEKARKIRNRLQVMYFLKMRISSGLTLISTVLVVGLMLVPLSEGTISIGIFTSLATACGTIVGMAGWQLSNLIYSFTNTKEYLKDLTEFSMLAETEGALDKPSRESTEIKKIEFHNVTFNYPGVEQVILKDLSMTLYGDKHYSFVGRNGAGKTTITKLLTGLYTNYTGDILINDKNLKEYTQAELKGLFSVVYQDFARYEVSLRDSIGLGNVNGCDDGVIEKSVETVGLNDEVNRFKDGLDTPLGKTRTDGTDVSGGQWQRIALARTLVSPCPVHILDEPTAALDPISERNVYELFGRVSKGMMTIFITHRLGAARLADEILVLEDGGIVEQGSHDSLMEKGGLYAQMFEAQRSWYAEDETPSDNLEAITEGARL
jgi:ATP-binding cassette subfamily B protein